jgi:hypothetical protein
MIIQNTVHIIEILVELIKEKKVYGRIKYQVLTQAFHKIYKFNQLYLIAWTFQSCCFHYAVAVTFTML